MATVSSIIHNQTLKLNFNRLKENGKAGKTGIVALERKLLVLIYMLYKNDMNFQKDYGQDTREKHIGNESSSLMRATADGLCAIETHNLWYKIAFAVISGLFKNPASILSPCAKKRMSCEILTVPYGAFHRKYCPVRQDTFCETKRHLAISKTKRNLIIKTALFEVLMDPVMKILQIKF